jgi:membrane protein implicated in regulation of membrane protease activity
MIGILLLYFIGKYFKDLAELNNKKPWPWAILGIVIYYAGTFLGGIIIAGISIAIDYNLDGIPDIVVSLMALPFGLLATWIGYRMLEKSWSRQTNVDTNTLDDGLF